MSRLLIIDDSIFICESIKNILSEENIKIEFAHTGQMGIDLINNKKPDLILLDINLPDIDGYKLCKYIKSNKSMNNIPILFITSMSESESIVNAFRVGASDYINKPFCDIELKARISAHLRAKIMYDKIQSTNLKLTELLNENKKLAITDSLTSLYNRRYLMSHIDSISKNKNVCSIIIGDIDNFKRINDTFGHIVGDKVLVKTSEIIKDNAGKNAMVGRLGGEEFIIVIKDTGINEATKIAEQIRQKINEDKIDIEDKSIRYTITFGVAELDFNQDIENNIKKADERLYMGKNNGKNCVISFDI